MLFGYLGVAGAAGLPLDSAGVSCWVGGDPTQYLIGEEVEGIDLRRNL